MVHNPIIQCDTNRCVGCRACEAACKAANQVEPGIRYRWVNEIWQGGYPAVTCRTESTGCYHCEDTPCAVVCPANAISRDAATGAVLVDLDRCSGTQACLAACPYDVPQFDVAGKMRKCDLCIDQVKENQPPICVTTCPSGALSIRSAP